MPEYQSWLGATQSNLAAILLRLNDEPGEALKLYEQAISHQQAALKSSPTNIDYRTFLRNHYEGLAEALLATADHADLAQAAAQRSRAVDAYRQALKIGKELAENFPMEPGYCETLVWFHERLGSLFIEMGRSKEAQEEYRQAVALLQKLDGEFPSPKHRQRLATDQSYLGHLLATAGERSEAEARYRSAIQTQEKLVSEYPGVVAYQHDLGGTLNNFGLMLLDAGRLDEARDAFTRAIACQQAALTVDSDNPSYQQFLSNHYWGLAETLLRQGKYAEAAQAARKLASVRPEDAQDSYDAACFLARCVVLAHRDQKLAQQQREETASAYADQAMDLLRRSVERGFRDAEKLNKDADLTPLRERDDFQELLAELQAKDPENK
ncbi:MAG: hypothetical protein KatS3mg110_4496 [Pirellulaceae bacterium]|nr:MAG: hypothetical protein KatS3mg110_4496 [Pirellulaceae bacterium]